VFFLRNYNDGRIKSFYIWDGHPDFVIDTSYHPNASFCFVWYLPVDGINWNGEIFKLSPVNKRELMIIGIFPDEIVE